jgi:hypothetical protein
MTDSDRIIQLTAAVAELQDEVARLRARRTMRQSHSCPACGGTRVIHFKQVKEMAHNSMVELALQKSHSVFWGLRHTAAALEAFVCPTCLLVEWHVISLDGVEIDGTEVVELDGAAAAPPSSPYR